MSWPSFMRNFDKSSDAQSLNGMLRLKSLLIPVRIIAGRDRKRHWPRPRQGYVGLKARPNSAPRKRHELSTDFVDQGRVSRGMAGRLELAAYRLIDKYSRSHLQPHHRAHPGSPDHLLINLYGLSTRRSPPPAW